MYAKYFKRLIDFCFSLFGLILLSPLMVVLTVTGAIVMKGNPFFIQKRPGKKDKNGNEKIFSLIKFRTMTCEKDKDGNLLPDELRLNKYGRFLRATSLDELPELVCIMCGYMSLIGPRPLLPKYLDRFTEEQRHRHDVRPGLTGLAQINGRNALCWEDRFKLDLEYVANVTFLGDLKIFFQTVLKVLKREGISSEASATMEEFMGTVDLNGTK
mgnify:FL=1